MTPINPERLDLETSRGLPGSETLLMLAHAFLPLLGMPRLVASPPGGQEGGALEVRIRKAETRYQTLVERIPVVTFIVSFEKRQSEIYVSPQVEKMLGYTAVEWIENPILWYERLHPDDRSRWNTDFSRTISRAAPFKGDYRFLAKDGRAVWIHGEVTVERDGSGQPSFLQGIGYDITDLKKAEDVLRRSREELEELVKGRTTEIEDINKSLKVEITHRQKLLEELKEINEQLNQFAYVVSHDLKAPLRAINSLADWLVADHGDALGEAGREQLRLLQGRTKRMNALIDGILRYSRITRQHEIQVMVDVNVVVHEVCDMVSPPPAIVVDIAAGFPTILCERTRLTQVFENLVSNAVKYMDKPSGQISIGFQDVGDQWKFHVRDTGPGIEEKYFDKIFQIFQTLTARDERESTGIGLAIVKKNVELFGGKVWVESKPGNGSTFYFQVPKSGAMGGDTPLTGPASQ